MRAFSVKTELVDSSGQHIRYLPGLMARAMVAAGHADVANANGKVRSVRLIVMASSYARMVGLPSDGWPIGVRFT